jgi:hypothetical protein
MEERMAQKQTENVINYHPLESASSWTLQVVETIASGEAFQASGDEIRIFYDIEIFLFYFFFLAVAIEFQSWSVAYGIELKFYTVVVFFFGQCFTRLSINGNKRRLCGAKRDEKLPLR